MVKCPICHSNYANLRQHLRTIHLVFNLEERAILLKMARSRLPLKNEVCPVCAKKCIHTDRHVCKVHKDLTEAKRMDALHTLTWRVAVRELKALRQTNPEVPLATCLDEEEEPVVTPSAAESPSLDAQEVHPEGLPQSWGTPTQAWGRLPVWMGPYPPQGMWATPIQVWAPSSDVEAAPLQLVEAAPLQLVEAAPLQVVEAAPVQALGDAPTQEVGGALSQVLGCALRKVLSPPPQVSAPLPEAQASCSAEFGASSSPSTNERTLMNIMEELGFDILDAPLNNPFIDMDHC
ncbi:hypothetical protein M9458_050841 [Cirrhinus mrigala]|uniref:C2H2-type domain-containing protein n=1 Tax=Cirrhinus mrigala TaxID=683832 RepID=A0ABD0MV24_CIRMR